MGAMSAVGDAVSAVKRNPVIIAVTLLVGIAQIPQLLAQYLDSSAAIIVSGLISLAFLLFFPFYFGGVIGMASEALHGKTSFGTFLREGRANYASMFGAYLLVVVLMIIYGIALVVFGGLGGVLAFSAGSAGAGAGSFLITIAIILLLFVLLLGIIFFTQFFGQAIVLDDRSAVGGFRGSISAVRGNKFSTLGYMVVIFVFSAVAGAFGGVIGILPAIIGAENVFVVAVVLSIVLAIVTGIVGAFTTTYSVAFYGQIRSPTEQDQESHGSSSDDSVPAP